MRRLLPVIALLAACGSLPTAIAQQRFRAGVELVPLNVSVSDGTRFITDIEQEEFEVFEDGVKQNVSFFSRRQQPIALAILLDTSNSMDGLIEQAKSQLWKICNEFIKAKLANSDWWDPCHPGRY